MKNFSKIIFLMLIAVFLVGNSAFAIPINRPDDRSLGLDLQDVFNDIATDGENGVNAFTDYIDDNNDSTWSITGSGGSLATFIIEIAGYAGTNTIGIYDTTDITKKVQLFAGGQSAGDQSAISIKADGSVYHNFGDTGIDFAGNSFGYYIDASAGNQNNNAIFYSDTNLNTDGVDHMFAYQGDDREVVQLPNLAAGTWVDSEFILAFEDLYGGGDFDYTDLVVMVESVEPIPEPATLFLLGSGLLGLVGYSRKKMAA